MVDGVRSPIITPQELVEAVDQLVGERERNEFIAQAVEEKLARRQRHEALIKAAGSINLADYPQWQTPKRISDWVHEQRMAELSLLPLPRLNRPPGRP